MLRSTSEGQELGIRGEESKGTKGTFAFDLQILFEKCNKGTADARTEHLKLKYEVKSCISNSNSSRSFSVQPWQFFAGRNFNGIFWG